MDGNEFEHDYIESNPKEDSGEEIRHIDYLDEPIYVIDPIEKFDTDIHIYVNSNEDEDPDEDLEENEEPKEYEEEPIKEFPPRDDHIKQNFEEDGQIEEE